MTKSAPFPVPGLLGVLCPPPQFDPPLQVQGARSPQPPERHLVPGGASVGPIQAGHRSRAKTAGAGRDGSAAGRGSAPRRGGESGSDRHPGKHPKEGPGGVHGGLWRPPPFLTCIPFNSQEDLDQEKIRELVISMRQQIYAQNEAEVSKRWNFEDGVGGRVFGRPVPPIYPFPLPKTLSPRFHVCAPIFPQQIKRPYFHVKPLERAQLRNWRDYLDYEMAAGSHERTIVLFERCVIACALYEEFWIKVRPPQWPPHPIPALRFPTAGSRLSPQKHPKHPSRRPPPPQIPQKKKNPTPREKQVRLGVCFGFFNPPLPPPNGWRGLFLTLFLLKTTILTPFF